MGEKDDQGSSKRLDLDYNPEFERSPKIDGEAGLNLLKAIRVIGKSKHQQHLPRTPRTTETLHLIIPSSPASPGVRSKYSTKYSKYIHHSENPGANRPTDLKHPWKNKKEIFLTINKENIIKHTADVKSPLS